MFEENIKTSTKWEFSL